VPLSVGDVEDPSLLGDGMLVSRCMAGFGGGGVWAGTAVFGNAGACCCCCCCCCVCFSLGDVLRLFD
jgi:hypothetical protein